MIAGMDRKTGSKYVKSGKLPSDQRLERKWRTRKDPFSSDWVTVEEMLRDCPEFEAKTLFEWLQKKKPGQYPEGQLRTFQRRVQHWRALEGPDQEVFFDQQHRPGEAFQTDFTGCSRLGITINGEPFTHLLCHVVLPFSNWESVTVCRSESFMALKRGVQDALYLLGRVTDYHQTDNLSAATHNLHGTEARPFNEDYARFIEYFGMTPRTIGIGKPNQNGDVESLNGALKRRLEQHLKLRGNRDFESVESYETWLRGVIAEANGTRTERIEIELKVMRELKVSRLSDYVEEEIRVNRGSLIRVKGNSYSVPSRLKGEKVRVRIYEDHLEVYYGGVKQLETERLLGRSGYRVDYRHVIWSLVRKPGAFSRYRYREEFFPSLIFRRTYDVLCDGLGRGTKADSHYLRILFQAAAVSETEVETALELMLTEGIFPDADRVKVLVQPQEAAVPEMAPFNADLREYDSLLPRCSNEVAP